MEKKEFIGKNSLENIKYISKEKNFEKILIFAGKKSFSASGAEKQLIDILTKFRYEVFYKSSELPEIEDLKKFIFKINNFKPDLIVAIGGGAVLDLAKTSNCFFDLNEIETSIKKSEYNLKNKFCPLVAVPTTAGSGAEATANAVIYVNKIKYSVEGDIIRPDYIMIDPNLILSTPKSIAASAGFDAIAQAIESMISMKSTKESVQYSTISLNDSLESFEKHINDKTFETSFKMSTAALNAGKAISISKTTAPHALSYPFTAFHGIAHGHAVYLTLNDFLKFNFNNLQKSKSTFDLSNRFEVIFKIFKVNNINDLTSKISNIGKNVGLENNFNKLNISKKDFENILNGVNTQRLSNNPIEINLKDIKEILNSKF
jgi:alcohol dehydrogenase